MRLGQLLNGMALQDLQGDPELEVTGIAYDSRMVQPGYMFVALKGRTHDGHGFVGQALERGATSLMVENSVEVDPGTALIRVPNSRIALSKIARRFYDPPFSTMNLIGITGTNGKTTTSYLLEAILRQAGNPTGVIGTVNYRYPGHQCPAAVTTPESLDLMQLLRSMSDAGVSDVIMEVSSHALEQDRTHGCPFRIALFTNLSRDHLDYHRRMEAYFEAKSRLFRNLGQKGAGPLTRAVINGDDPQGRELCTLTDVPVVRFGRGRDCDVRATEVKVSRAGLRARMITWKGEIPIESPLIGEFNIYNILAASAAALCLDVDLATVASAVSSTETVPGRLEWIKNSRELAVIVDYAHTPDALEKAMRSVRPLAAGRLITVFGCGGDRDRGKRRAMGAAAGRLSDVVIITSDNPRTEEPAAIATRIEEGVREAGLEKIAANREQMRNLAAGYFIELERRAAIHKALAMAGPEDLVLIAGKGHEDYQIVGTQRRDFDDRKVAASAAGEL